jgi:hypothetical protein
MEGDHRRRVNERLPDDSERSSRGPTRRTRDSGAIGNVTNVKRRAEPADVRDTQWGPPPLSVRGGDSQ